MSRRAVITGLGLVTPLGVGKDAFFERLVRGDCGIGEIRSFDTGRFPSHQGAEVNEYQAKEFISAKNLRKMDRLSRMAVGSARMALDDAGLTIDASNRDRIGMILGVAFGSTEVTAGLARTLFEEGPNAVNPFHVPNTVMNAPAGHASIELGFRGVNTTVNHKEVSAETAIAYAVSEIRKGTADVMLAGGADVLGETLFESLTHFRALSPTAGGEEKARPLDVCRNGYTVGEGAGVLCLEALEHAESRGAAAYAEVAGWGMSASPSPLTDWTGDDRGVVLAVKRAFTTGGIEAEDVDCVYAAANGGIKLDALEAGALCKLFGKDPKPFVTSIKGALGESFSSGGIRAAAMTLSLQTGVLPPTFGLRNPMPELTGVSDQKREREMGYGLLNAIASGGAQVSLLFRKMD
ncbi:MAG: beta-ketoacyl-[acyl-carrier-protein] synthase family protein [Deltaproteobacteria bacterium]|nr:beta-ketoacyl-[acyl-carrier-protein] synthase family protein [Deltaproteobacteria bacterium]